MTVTTIRLSVGPTSTEDGVRVLLDFFTLGSRRRNCIGRVDSHCNTRMLASH